jgi:DNA-binding transcriptional LysR family regulator
MADIDLADLEAFAAVARARSFRGAAAARGGSASTLSEAVRRLEARLGVRLLNRTTRSVTATEAGQRLLERLVPALGEVQAALEVVDGFRDTPRGVLRLNVPSIVARVVLPELAVGFLAVHPEVTLEVSAEDNFVDVLAAGFDAGVRYDERLEQDMIAVPIGPRVQRFVTAAAPTSLAEHGQPTHPSDLMQHMTIRHRFHDRPPYLWEFEKDGEIVRVDPPTRVTANSLEMEMTAALAGLGIISSFDAVLGPHIASGALRPVLQDWWESFPGPFLYYPSRRLMPGPLRAFVDYVKAQPANAAA